MNKIAAIRAVREAYPHGIQAVTGDLAGATPYIRLKDAKELVECVMSALGVTAYSPVFALFRVDTTGYHDDTLVGLFRTIEGAKAAVPWRDGYLEAHCIREMEVL